MDLGRLRSVLTSDKSGFSLRWLLLLGSTGSRTRGLSSCSSRTLEHRLNRYGTVEGLVAPLHVGSSQTRDRTHVSCIGRRTLHHRATSRALVDLLFFFLISQLLLEEGVSHTLGDLSVRCFPWSRPHEPLGKVGASSTCRAVLKEVGLSVKAGLFSFLLSYSVPFSWVSQ